MNAMHTDFPSFGDKPAPAQPQKTPVPWNYLAGLIACAAAVFIFTFGVAMVGFGLGVSGGIAPFVSNNESKLAWHSAPVAVEAERSPPPPLIVRPRREEKTPDPEFRIVQASVSQSDLPVDAASDEGWAPIEDEALVDDFADEFIAPGTAQN